MASNSDQLDSAAEQNIIILQELKAAITAKNDLLKMQIEEQSFFNASPNFNPDLSTEELHESIVNKTNIDNAFFNIFNKLVLDSVTNDDAHNPEIFATKKKLLEALKETIQSSDETLQMLVEKLNTIKIKDEQLQKELRSARAKAGKDLKEHQDAVEKKKRDTNPLLASYDERKKEIIERVRKINTLRSIINGMVFNLDIDWSNNPEIEEILRQCSTPYNIDDI